MKISDIDANYPRPAPNSILPKAPETSFYLCEDGRQAKHFVGFWMERQPRALCRTALVTTPRSRPRDGAINGRDGGSLTRFARRKDDWARKTDARPAAP